MLSRRQKDILQQLERADDFISIRTLCETCSLSEKTMLSELTVIEAVSYTHLTLPTTPYV